MSRAHPSRWTKGAACQYFWLEGGVGVLSQNHSWDGLTRPARINDNLPPAVAGSPEQRCRVDSQRGTLAALRTQSGHERSVPGAARWVCGDVCRERGVIRPPGNQVARQCGRGWGGSPCGLRGELGRGAPRLRPDSRRCGHSRSAQPGPSDPAWWPDWCSPG